MLHAARICALLATIVLASLPSSAEAAATPPRTSIDAPSSLLTSKSKSSPKPSTKKSTPAKSTPKSTARATSGSKQKTTVCCKGCDACRQRAAKNGVKVK